MVPCQSTAEEVSFEWSHHRISSTDSKIRTTLHVSIIDSGSDRVKCSHGKLELANSGWQTQVGVCEHDIDSL